MIDNDTAPGGSRREEPSPSHGVRQGFSIVRGVLKRLPLSRIIVFGVAIVGLYFVWPQLVNLFSQLPQLRGILWLWFVLMGLLEAASFACAWGLMRLTLNERSWFLIATAQLTSNAISRVIPGGAASGGTASYQMFTARGASPERVVSGLTATTLLSAGVLLSLPVLALPAILFGGATVAHTLLHALVYGMSVFTLILAGGAVALFSDEPLRAAGTVVQGARNRLFKRRKPLADLPDRLIDERDLIKNMLGRRWWEALPYAAGNWLLDYTALLAALAATGVHPRASLVLIAYVVAALLGMVPITPGGLGFVEVGLVATLGLAGVGAADATLATLAYRLVSFWMPIPAGGVAYVLYRRRFGVKTPPSAASPPTATP
ncbi:MAG TPA: YbhN family protein [Thermoleophilia bacterium]|nr:YbhN family protein [Thermoleophilia bacterium]